MTRQKFDPRELRQALGAFVTGVTVVTTMDGDGVPRGFTANSFTSVSLDPPLVLVCMKKKAASYRAFAAADGYAVNILAEDQRDVSKTFAGPTIDRFASVAWEPGPAGHPVFADTAAWFDCVRHQDVDAGDHVIMIARVVGFGNSPHPPLGYARGTYISAGLEREAIAAGRRPSLVSAILERVGEILLVEDSETGLLDLPSAARVGNPDEPGTLLANLSGAGVSAEVGFIFSIFEDEGGGTLAIVYRGSAQPGQPTDEHHRFYAFDAIPWHRIAEATTRTMLRRYVDERLQARFGVYVGGTVNGEIRALEKEE